VEGSDYLTALNEPVTLFSPAELTLRIEQNGMMYTCTSGIVQEGADQNVRLIESGQYVQRFDHVGLVFTDSSGKKMDGRARLEITAWADRVAFLLEASMIEGVEKAGIQLVAPSGKDHRAGGAIDTAALVLQPQRDQALEPLDASKHVLGAKVMKNAKAIDCGFDAEENGLRFELPLDRVRFPEDKERLDEFEFELINPSKHEIELPLIFNEIKSQAITGTSMVLCDEDGRTSDHRPGCPCLWGSASRVWAYALHTHSTVLR
jgi:hypothetical protein